MILQPGITTQPGNGVTMYFNQSLKRLRIFSILQLFVGFFVGVSGFWGLCLYTVTLGFFPPILGLGLAAGLPSVVASIISLKLCIDGRLVTYGLRTANSLKCLVYSASVAFVLTFAGLVTAIVLDIVHFVRCSNQMPYTRFDSGMFSCIDVNSSSTNGLAFAIGYFVLYVIGLGFLVWQVIGFVQFRRYLISQQETNPVEQQSSNDDTCILQENQN